MTDPEGFAHRPAPCYSRPMPAEKERSQSEKFKDAARKAECDPNEKRWTERLKKVAKQTEKPE